MLRTMLVIQCGNMIQASIGAYAKIVVQKLPPPKKHTVQLEITLQLVRKRRLAMFVKPSMVERLITPRILLNGYMMQSNTGELAFMVAIRLWEKKRITLSRQTVNVWFANTLRVLLSIQPLTRLRPVVPAAVMSRRPQTSRRVAAQTAR